MKLSILRKGNPKKGKTKYSSESYIEDETGDDELPSEPKFGNEVTFLTSGLKWFLPKKKIYSLN